MEYFSPTLGLITKYDPTTENGGSFFAFYLVLKLMLGQPISQKDVDIYIHKMKWAYVGRGLYLRSMHHTKRTVSHDEITGMIVSSKILKTYHAKAIADRIARGFGNYPASGEFKIYNPADYYAWFTLTNKWYSFIFAPNYTINLLLSTSIKKGDVDSKLNNMIELYLAKDISWYSRILWKFFKWRMVHIYGDYWVKELFSIYFWSETEDFPLLQLSRQLNKEI